MTSVDFPAPDMPVIRTRMKPTYDTPPWQSGRARSAPAAPSPTEPGPSRPRRLSPRPPTHSPRSCAYVVYRAAAEVARAVRIGSLAAVPDRRIGAGLQLA